MRNAETILSIIRDRGQRGLPVEDLYRQMFKPELFLAAYGKIAPHQGALTRGVTDETADAMSLAKIRDICEAIRYERYRFSPVRRVHIPKPNGKTRPLGVPTWSDKLVQEVMRQLLEAYYEPRFSPCSHGFRPGRGCHTALMEIKRTWKGTTWFIEGDIAACFDRLDHQVLLATLRQGIRDNRFLRLIENCLKAGYLENWRYGKTLSGTPQGGIVSPILSNIYLDRLDKFVEEELLPAYNKGGRREPNPEYTRLSDRHKRLKKRGQLEDAKAVRNQMRRTPSVVLNDPEYRRLRYVRYADDFLLGFTGPKAEAEEIKRRIAEFLREELKLELSEAKTLITHGRTQAARFLGHDIVVFQEDSYIGGGTKRRTLNGQVALSVPKEVSDKHCKRYLRGGKGIHRLGLIHDTPYSIVATYASEFRGLSEFYKLAYNRSSRLAKLRWLMEMSMTKTLAQKLRLSVKRVYRRYTTTIATPAGPRKVMQVRVNREGKPPLVARWGAFDLAPSNGLRAPILDTPKTILGSRTELVKRLEANVCELCDSTLDVEVHHIRKLSDLKRRWRGRQMPVWVKTMAERRRKTLVVCHACHQAIHRGTYDGPGLKTLESRMT